jgi:hypothetical protein
MTNDNSIRIDVGICSNCGQTLRMKPRGLRENMRLTCKCGHINSVVIDQETLSQHGAIRTPIKEDIYQISNLPLYRLLDGHYLRAMWVEEEAKETKRIEENYKDIPRQHWPTQLSLPDLISVSMNPYLSEQNARASLSVLVDRVRAMDRARPWSIELFENVECAIRGLLDAPFFIFLGMTGYNAYEVFKEIVSNLRSDHPRIGAGAEWEIWSQTQGNQWRGDHCARLLERWVFLDADTIQTYREPG